MEIGFSTRHFANQRLTSHILDRIHKVGVEHLEIFAARQHLDYRDSNQVRDVAQWFEDHRLSLNSVHAPLFADFDNGRSGGLAISPSYTEKRPRIESMDEIKRAIEIAEHLPFRYLIVHLGRPDDEYDLRKFDAAFTSLEHLKIFAKERGAEILLENGTDALSTPERLLQFIQYTRLELSACFDVGHAHITGGVVQGMEILKPLAATVHLNDNRGEKDEHLMPLEGTVDWPPVIAALRATTHPLPALIELHDQGPGLDGLGSVQEVIRKMGEL
jgi:sugar phosphate isomerase/epimerase